MLSKNYKTTDLTDTVNECNILFEKYSIPAINTHVELTLLLSRDQIDLFHLSQHSGQNGKIIEEGN